MKTPPVRSVVSRNDYDCNGDDRARAVPRPQIFKCCALPGLHFCNAPAFLKWPLSGLSPSILLAQDRAAARTPHWGVRCCANVVLSGRACPKTCVSIGVIVVLYVFHDAAPHYDDGKHCSQSEVTQNCVKKRSCKPCCQSENCCPAISHYDTPLCYNLVSMITGLSIPYSLAKDHGYMPELSLFPAYVRTGHVRTYAAIDLKRAI